MKLFLLFVIWAVGLSSVMGQIMTWGTQGPGDELLEHRNAYSSFSITKDIKEVIRFPPKPKFYDAQITAIKVVDKINNGPHRKAQVVNGGVGTNFVLLRFSAVVFRTFDYDVYIYGKKK